MLRIVVTFFLCVCSEILFIGFLNLIITFCSWISRYVCKRFFLPVNVCLQWCSVIRKHLGISGMAGTWRRLVSVFVLSAFFFLKDLFSYISMKVSHSY